MGGLVGPTRFVVTHGSPCVTYRALGPVETGSVVNGPAMTPKCLFTVKYYLDCTPAGNVYRAFGLNITVQYRYYYIGR